MTLLATLAASASYIAVPAAMRLAIPEANPTLSLAAVLGVTFPFNILAGDPAIPLAGPANCRSDSMKLQTEKRTVLTVITEAAIENVLLRDLKRSGVSGYTVLDARGTRFRRGVRDAAWGEAANIRIEVICTRALAETVMQDLLTRYYDNYGMVAHLHDVDIVRLDGF